MDWIYLLVAGIGEMLGVVSMNIVHRKRNWQSWLFLFSTFGMSLSFLALAMQTLPAGTAYAIWTGIGAAGGTILGMYVFGESKNGWRIFFLLLVIGSAIGLKLVNNN